MKLTEIFVSEAIGNAFVYGMSFCTMILFVMMAVLPFIDLFWDWLRGKAGYPVSRYVRWVKEQDDVNNK